MIAASVSSPLRSDRVNDWIGIFKRRKVIILSAICLGLGLAALVLMATPPRYTAEASLVLEARKVQVILQDAVVSRLPQDSPVLRTELDIISSRSLAEKALEKLGEDHRSAVVPSVAGAKVAEVPVTEAPVDQGINGWRSLLSWKEDAAQRIPEDPLRANVDRLLSGLRVSNDGRSYTIFIAYTAGNPLYAARVANAFAESYLEQQTGLQAGATRQASAWLGKKLDDLRQTLQTSEMAVENARRGAGLIESNGAPLQVQRLEGLNRELAAARASRAGAEARLEIARGLAQDNGAGSGTFAEVLGSPVIQLLRKDQAQYSRELVALEDAGASKSTQIPALKSQLASLQQQIAAETERVLLSLSSEVDVARRKEEVLTREFNDLQTSYGGLSQAMIHVKQLEREAEANRAVYESFLNRYKQTLEQDGLAAPEARLVSRAEPPRRPSTARLPMIVFGLAGGLGVGLALALMLERFDDRVRLAALIEERTGAQVIGQIPQAPHRRRFAPIDDPVIRRGSAYSRAFAKLQATLRLSPHIADARVIMVTSALAQDGKTSTCLSLARVMALSGEKVIVIDADWHRPSVARALRGHTSRGMADVARGDATAAEIIQVDDQSGAHFIAPGNTAGLPQSALGAEAIGAFIAQLRQRYDLILLDTPPVLSSAEAALIGRFADATLFIVRWGRTSTHEVIAGLRELSLCGIARVSLVLDRVDPRLLPQYEATDAAGRGGGGAGTSAARRDSRPRVAPVARPATPATARVVAIIPAGSERS